MKTIKRVFSIGALALALAGCIPKTQFLGEPKIMGGAAGCQAICQSQGMVLAGMVFMGQYSDGCICAVPGQPGAISLAVAGAGQGAAGVMMQMDDEEEQRQQQQRQQQQQQQQQLQQQQRMLPRP